MRCQRVFLTLLLYAATTLERTMSASTAGQRYRRCPDGQMLSSAPQWSDRVTSLAACLFQCNEDDQCLSLNVCPEGDGSGDVNCYFLYGASGDDEASVCAGLATAFLPTCYHVAKAFPPPEPTTVSTTEASTSTATTTEPATTTTATTTGAATTTTATTTGAATTTTATTTGAATTTTATTTRAATTTTATTTGAATTTTATTTGAATTTTATTTGAATTTTATTTGAATTTTATTTGAATTTTATTTGAATTTTATTTRAATTTTATTTGAATTTTATTTGAATTTTATTTGAATTTTATTTGALTTTTEAATTTTAIPLNCQNGGTLLQDNTCLCTMLFAGQECDRYPRDCTEMKELAGGSAIGGTYSLHPVGSASPSVQVKCPFNDKGDTMVLQWYTGGTDNNVQAHYTNDNSFFVGMIEMYNILQQGDYTLQVWMDIGNFNYPSAFYVNFNMLDGAGKFAIDYDSFYADGTIANGWPSTPAPFHSLPQASPCAVTLNCGGWAFDNGCVAPACLFQSSSLHWPLVGGALTPVYNVEFYLTRTSPLL